jgi:putative intracellular protease/amidase
MTPKTLPTAADTTVTENRPAADPQGTATPSRRVLVGRFARHYVEMVLAMFAGMLVLGGLLRLVLGVAGVEYGSDSHPYLAATEMGLTMAAGMAFWMHYRRHHWSHVVEMSAAMLLPLVFLFPLAWTGGVSPASLPMLEHVAMFPLMLAVMLRTPRAYTGPVVGRLTDRPRLRTVLRRSVVTVLLIGVVVGAPLGYGFSRLAASTDDSYAVYEGGAPVANVSAAVPAHDPSRPTAVVVVGAVGAVASDVLPTFETLAVSKIFNTYVVAPEHGQVSLSGGLDIVPQLTFDELADRLGGKAPDAIVVPAMPDAGEPSNAPVRDWLAAQQRDGALVVGVCAGAGVVASAGLLDGRAATSHWYRISGLAEQYPDTDWKRGIRYVDEGRVMTTAGILSGIDGTLRVIERFAGQDAARSVAASVGWRHYSAGRSAELPPQASPLLNVVALLNAAYRSQPTIGVRLDDGVREMALAAAFDVYEAQSFATQTLSVAPGGRPVVSRHGLTFVPRSQPDDPALDRTIVPADGASGFPYDAALSDLARTADTPSARWAAKALEYHPDELTFAGPGLSPALIARPLLFGLGAAGLIVGLFYGAVRLRRRISSRPA